MHNSNQRRSLLGPERTNQIREARQKQVSALYGDRRGGLGDDHKQRPRKPICQSARAVRANSAGAFGLTAMLVLLIVFTFHLNMSATVLGTLLHNDLTFILISTYVVS
jgi:hypothetical protein